MLGDSCFEAIGELRYDLPPTTPQITQAQLYAFTDYGTALHPRAGRRHGRIDAWRVGRRRDCDSAC